MERVQCHAWMATNSSILKSARPPSQDCISEYELRHGVVLVGVVLPMSAFRALACYAAILDGVKEVLAVNQKQQLQICLHLAAIKTVQFQEHVSIKDLRNKLSALSLDELCEKSGKKSEERVALCNDIISTFVRENLRGDLLTALENARKCDAKIVESKMTSLLNAWGADACAVSNEDRIKLVVESLNSETRWHEILEWVHLYCGRMQGRKRMGVKRIVHKENVIRCKLTNSEVLAAHIYTGGSPFDNPYFSFLIPPWLSQGPCSCS